MSNETNSPPLNVDEEDVQNHVIPLMLKYSDAELLKIFQRSRQQVKPAHPTSLASQFNASSVSVTSSPSAPPPSIWSKASRRSFDSSTTLNSSIATSSIYSSDSSPSQATSSDNTYFCTDGNDFPTRATFGRKSDFIKHETKHHRTDEDWQCPVNSCPVLCDRFIDLKKHYKTAHGGSLRSQNLVLPMRTQLIPQEIFACGFVGCKLWFDDWQKRCDHVTQHMLAGCNHTQWDGTTIMRNLLRQPLLHQAWKQLLQIRHGADKSKWPTMVWDVVKSPQTLRQKLTRILQLKLERRDYRPGIFHIIEYAYELGHPDLATAGPDALQHLPRILKTPSSNSLPESASAKVLDKLMMRFPIALHEEPAEHQPQPRGGFWKEPSPLSLEAPILSSGDSMSAHSATPELNELPVFQPEPLLSPIELPPSFADSMQQHQGWVVSPTQQAPPQLQQQHQHPQLSPTTQPPPLQQQQQQQQQQQGPKPAADMMDVDAQFQQFVLPGYPYMGYSNFDGAHQYTAS